MADGLFQTFGGAQLNPLAMGQAAQANTASYLDRLKQSVVTPQERIAQGELGLGAQQLAEQQRQFNVNDAMKKSMFGQVQGLLGNVLGGGSPLLNNLVGGIGGQPVQGGGGQVAGGAAGGTSMFPTGAGMASWSNLIGANSTDRSQPPPWVELARLLQGGQ